MDAVINYTTGGLGNRLRPLSSAYAISKETGRELAQYWDNSTTNGVMANFDDLFENDIRIISAEELEQLDSFVIYSDLGIIDRLSKKYGLHSLKKMANSGNGRVCTRESYQNNNVESNVILYCNNFIPNTNRSLCHEFIQNLVPVKEIREKIEMESESLGINKEIIGIHARGTDFNVDVSYYVNQIKQLLSSNSELKFFLSTDDSDYEKIICNEFKGKIITREKRLHM